MLHRGKASQQRGLSIINSSREFLVVMSGALRTNWFTMRFRNTRQTNLIGFFVLAQASGEGSGLVGENTNEGGLFCLHHGLSGLRDFADFCAEG